MKLKKATTPEFNDVPEVSDEALMDMPEALPSELPGASGATAGGRVATVAAFIASLAAAALIGAMAAMMYVNWNLIAEA